jgi:GTPase SAR1 family protein
MRIMTLGNDGVGKSTFV